MSIRVQLPSLGESVSQAQVASWKKKVGDFVKEGEILCVLDTDKVSIDLPADKSGVILELLWKEGDSLNVGDDLYVIDESVTSDASSASAVEPEPSKEIKESKEKDADPSSGSTPHALPAAEKMARDQGINLSSVLGTGKAGRITKGDVKEFLSKTVPDEETLSKLSELEVSSGAISEARSGERREPMSRLRKTIAKRMKDAQNTAALLTTFNEVDLGVLSDIRAKYRADFEKTHGVRLGFMSFFVKAVVHALKTIPIVNARIEGEDIVHSDSIDIGVAVSTSSGIVVPVLRNAPELSLAGIEEQIAFYAKKAREGTIALNDLKGGTFTITNGGVFGSMMSTPILNLPQSAILGMHKIEKRPVVIDDEIKIRPMMYLALSYDHRIIDGKEAVMFLQEIKSVLEEPYRFILGTS